MRLCLRRSRRGLANNIQGTEMTAMANNATCTPACTHAHEFESDALRINSCLAKYGPYLFFKRNLIEDKKKGTNLIGNNRVIRTIGVILINLAHGSHVEEH
jgi:hypothetical protein